jgi:hypothetical protein
MAKYKNFSIGAIKMRKQEDPSGPKEYYFQFQQRQNRKTGELVGPKVFPITLADGTIINDGDFANLFDTQVELQKLVNQGKLDAKKKSDMSFLKYNMVFSKKTEGNDDGGGEGSDINF